MNVHMSRLKSPLMSAPINVCAHESWLKSETLVLMQDGAPIWVPKCGVLKAGFLEYRMQNGRIVPAKSAGGASGPARVTVAASKPQKPPPNAKAHHDELQGRNADILAVRAALKAGKVLTLADAKAQRERDAARMPGRQAQPIQKTPNLSMKPQIMKKTPKFPPPTAKAMPNKRRAVSDPKGAKGEEASGTGGIGGAEGTASSSGRRDAASGSSSTPQVEPPTMQEINVLLWRREKFQRQKKQLDREWRKLDGDERENEQEIAKLQHREAKKEFSPWHFLDVEGQEEVLEAPEDHDEEHDGNEFVNEEEEEVLEIPDDNEEEEEVLGTEEEWQYAGQWLEQKGNHSDIPKKFTPCKFFFKMSTGCMKGDNCEWSHNREIFGRDPFHSFMQSWCWESPRARSYKKFRSR